MKDEIKLFKPTASKPEHGIAMMFDLAGFSRFFAQPDVHMYVPKYLNHVLSAVKILVDGGKHYWAGDTSVKLPTPIHWKFLGDGLLIIWHYDHFKPSQLRKLMNMCYNLRLKFSEVNKHSSKDVPVMDIPNQIRFGIAAGTIYKLRYESSRNEEYIGYCINLASRLQSYCRELGFIVSARLNPEIKDLEEHGYLKVVAKGIKGFPNEIVIVDKEEFDELEPTIKDNLFEEI